MPGKGVYSSALAPGPCLARAHEIMVGGFDVDAGNVVGEQHQLVRVDFVQVLVGQIGPGNEA